MPRDDARLLSHRQVLAGGVHRGLHVGGGSIIPRSLAATPRSTIGARAERGVEPIA